MMNKRLDIMGKLLAAALTVVLSASCSAIDEDRSNCDSDYQVDYEVQLVTNMSIELRTQLNALEDAGIAQVLREHLKTIFTDRAHDVDLSFYDTEGNQPRLQHDQHIMDASQQSYTINLPKRQYKHLAVANVLNNSVVSLLQDDFCRTSQLGLTTRDTIDSHTTGLFTARLPMNVLEGVDQQFKVNARLPMNVLEGVDQQFKVNLYMANCAAALVVDPRKQDISNIRVYSTGFASQFNINDSTYTFAAPSPIVRTAELLDVNSGMRCYCSVNFPSREPYYNSVGSRSVIETEDPFIAQPRQETLWQLKAYVTRKDGKITETVLSINKPLRAGQLMIIKGWITDDGVVHTSDQTVGVSVTLDWQEGGTYQPNL